MKLKTIVKIGTMVSVLLFVFAVGYYAFIRLDMTRYNREFNLFSLVPSSSVGLLEGDKFDTFIAEESTLNYSRELNGLQFSNLFHFLANGWREYATENVHGVNSLLNHWIVSFHGSDLSRDQVVYFRLGMTDEEVFLDMLRECLPSNFIPKEEMYRGKVMWIYPLSSDNFLVVYSEQGFMVLSYQKRLLEEVIDAQLDEASLFHDEVFSQILDKKKSHNFLTLYGRTASMPLLKTETECWSEYDIYMNSDVAYLTGDTFFPDGITCQEILAEKLQKVPVVKEEGLVLSSQKDSTALYMDQAFEVNDIGNGTLFNECVASLSDEAAFSLVVDMEKVEKEPERFQMYLPSFVLDHVSLFRSFILSSQFSLNGGRLSHIWVFTYKY